MSIDLFDCLDKMYPIIIVGLLWGKGLNWTSGSHSAEISQLNPPTCIRRGMCTKLDVIQMDQAIILKKTGHR